MVTFILMASVFLFGVEGESQREFPHFRRELDGGCNLCEWSYQPFQREAWKNLFIRSHKQRFKTFFGNQPQCFAQGVNGIDWSCVMVFAASAPNSAYRYSRRRVRQGL
jgi:hypothetical protein